MARRRRAFNRCRAWVTLAAISAVLGVAAELGHLQWTIGGPSGLRGRGVPFSTQGIATWRESGISMSRGAIGFWTLERSVAKENHDWGDGGAVFFGVSDELGGPPAVGRWTPRIGLAGLRTPAAAANQALFITVPLWPLTALLLIGSLLAYRRRWLGTHACAACGYDLRGLGDRPCPECGLTRPTA